MRRLTESSSVSTTKVAHSQLVPHQRKAARRIRIARLQLAVADEEVNPFSFAARNIEEGVRQHLLTEERLALPVLHPVKFVDQHRAALFAQPQEDRVGLLETEFLGPSPILVQVDVLRGHTAVHVALGRVDIFLDKPRSWSSASSGECSRSPRPAAAGCGGRTGFPANRENRRYRVRSRRDGRLRAT
jgi:hypothetical protein